MKHRITLEVDSSELFDMLQKMKGDIGPLGQRLTELLLVPTKVSFATDIGLGFYSVQVVEVTELPVISQP